MRILMLGDIYGNVGRRLVKMRLSGLRREIAADWVIANGENATGGAGLSPKHRDELMKAGVDAVTGGNHIFARPDWHELVASSRCAERTLRPHNLGGDVLPGRGWVILERPGVSPIAVINLAGRIFMEPGECPFRWADELHKRVPKGIPILVDFHAEATSEKIAMAIYLDGRVALVAGTHTHVQTSDERILPGGTAAITDLGMTGPSGGIIGVEAGTILDRFVKGYSDRFTCADGPGVIEGIFLDIDEHGVGKSIERIRVREET
ncbi:MAG: YmdB family metallophosphoesterase [Candidatus Riflebacteria bacterium]|nr:YmdB family metallophosphoesterase [Candidatus Riflebacteria bacterium]